MPMVPPAPPMFSTSMGWPSDTRIGSISARTMVSTAPPAASGTTMVIGFDGNVCAGAAEQPSEAANAARASNVLKRAPPFAGRVVTAP